jgi:site-specific DNA-adenine methylase
MRLPLFIVKTAGTKSWFVPYAQEFLGGWNPKTIVEVFAGSAIVGLTLLCEGKTERLVLAEKDKDYLAFWRAALGDPNFSYRVSKWTEQVLALPFDQQKPFVEASLERMKEQDPGFWILLRSRIGFNGKKVGGYMTEKSRGGMLCRWPRNLDASLDLLYTLRNKITVMEDGFEALAACDSEDSYAFIDPTYTLTKRCPGHKLYAEKLIDHNQLHATLPTWKGAWQLSYNACGAALIPTTKVVASTIKPDGQEEILYTKKGAMCGFGIEDDLVKMTSGTGRGGSRKKWELILSKRRLSCPDPLQLYQLI